MITSVLLIASLAVPIAIAVYVAVVDVYPQFSQPKWALNYEDHPACVGIPVGLVVLTCISAAMA